MNISENTNMYGNVTVTNADNQQVTVLSINANLDVARQSINLGWTFVDTAAVATNSAEVQPQIDDFLAQVRAKMVSLNYPVTI